MSAVGSEWRAREYETRAWEAAAQEEWLSLDRELREVAQERCALDAREAALLRRAEARQLWRAFGYASLLEYMERAMGYAPHTARERLRVARALEALPRLASALERGEVKHSAVRELTRVASEDTEEAWLDAARGKCLREVEAIVAGKRPGSHPDDIGDPNLRKRKIVLELTAEAYDLIRQASARLADLHGHRLSTEETIIASLRMALEPAAAAAPEAGRPAYQIAVKTCPECKRSWQHGGGRDMEINPEVVERARCDAEHLGSLDASEPERKTSTLTPRVREQVFARDGYACSVPGCRRTHGLDIHHIVFQEHGGGHQLSNLTLLCNLHHTVLHRGKLVIEGRAPDQLSVRFPHGHATDCFEHELAPASWLDSGNPPCPTGNTGTS